VKTWLIAAVSKDGKIGHGGCMPWPKLPRDRTWFHDITLAQDPLGTAKALLQGTQTPALEEPLPVLPNALIMGRKTFSSIGRTLPGRESIVLHTTGPHWTPLGAWCAHNMAQAWNLCMRPPGRFNAFFIGGSTVFAAALPLARLNALFLTEVDATYEQADTPWPSPASFLANGVIITPTQVWERTVIGPLQGGHNTPKYRMSVWERQ
jgi:dihydrofolate reductase